ncbi:MAG: hypothetical protein AAB276_09390, partial [Pseudomonadota bacterium]
QPDAADAVKNQQYILRPLSFKIGKKRRSFRHLNQVDKAFNRIQRTDWLEYFRQAGLDTGLLPQLELGYPAV